MLSRISEIRGGRDIMVIASDLSASRAPIGIDYTDILAVQDQLANMAGNSIDVVLETPGGLGDAVEDIVNIVREKYESVGMIVPGYAKGAGTIFAMAGDELLMGRASSLGPIDAQAQLADGSRFSADAFLEGLEKIKAEAEKSGRLTPAYIPILQNISPDEIRNCEDMRIFSRHLVTKWLAEDKFKSRDRHSDGGKVTVGERRRRACEIAAALCSRSKWMTRSRSIKVDDLKELCVSVTSYDDNADLSDAITRYYTLLRLSFEASASYKIFETPGSQICRFRATGRAVRPQARPAGEKSLEATCHGRRPSLDRSTASGRPPHPARRARAGPPPILDRSTASGRPPHPVPGGSMDKYFDPDVLAETRLQMGRMAETVRLSSEIKDLTDAVLSPPPKIRTVLGA